MRDVDIIVGPSHVIILGVSTFSIILKVDFGTVRMNGGE